MWSSLLKSIGIVNQQKAAVDKRLALVAKHLRRLYMKDVYAVKAFIMLKFVAFHVHRVAQREKKKEIAALIELLAQHCMRIGRRNLQQPEPPLEESDPLEQEQVHPPSDQ